MEQIRGNAKRNLKTAKDKMLDEYDLKILRAFNSLTNDKEVELSSWECMKKIFKNGKDKENMGIRLRIKKMCNMGLFQIHEDSKSIRWTMDKNNVQFKNIKLPDKKSNVICLKINDKWEMHEY